MKSKVLMHLILSACLALVALPAYSAGLYIFNVTANKNGGAAVGNQAQTVVADFQIDSDLNPLPGGGWNFSSVNPATITGFSFNSVTVTEGDGDIQSLATLGPVSAVTFVTNASGVLTDFNLTTAGTPLGTTPLLSINGANVRYQYGTCGSNCNNLGWDEGGSTLTITAIPETSSLFAPILALLSGVLLVIGRNRRGPSRIKREPLQVAAFQ